MKSSSSQPARSLGPAGPPPPGAAAEPSSGASGSTKSRYRPTRRRKYSCARGSALSPCHLRGPSVACSSLHRASLCAAACPSRAQTCQTRCAARRACSSPAISGAAAMSAGPRSVRPTSASASSSRLPPRAPPRHPTPTLMQQCGCARQRRRPLARTARQPSTTPCARVQRRAGSACSSGAVRLKARRRPRRAARPPAPLGSTTQGRAPRTRPTGAARTARGPARRRPARRRWPRATRSRCPGRRPRRPPGPGRRACARTCLSGRASGPTGTPARPRTALPGCGLRSAGICGTRAVTCMPARATSRGAQADMTESRHPGMTPRRTHGATHRMQDAGMHVST